MICSLLLRLLLQETKQKPSESPSLLLLLLLLFFFFSATHRQQWNNHSCSLERKPASLSIWSHAALRLSKSMTNYQPTNLQIIRTWNSNAFLLQCLLLPVCLPTLPPPLKKTYYLWEEKKRNKMTPQFFTSLSCQQLQFDAQLQNQQNFPAKIKTNKQTNNQQKTKRTKTRARSNTKTKQEIPPSPRD